MSTTETEAERLQSKLDDMENDRDFWRGLALSCFPESSLGQRNELLEEMKSPDGVLCDWGACTRIACDVRYSPSHGWLPVCQYHVVKGTKKEDKS